MMNPVPACARARIGILVVDLMFSSGLPVLVLGIWNIEVICLKPRTAKPVRGVERDMPTEPLGLLKMLQYCEACSAFHRS